MTHREWLRKEMYKFKTMKTDDHDFYVRDLLLSRRRWQETTAIMMIANLILWGIICG